MQSLSICQRSWSLVLPLEEELHIDTDKMYAFDLDYLGLIHFSGEKAIEFLQGQITSDVRRLEENNVLRGAICNLKGRVMTLFKLVKTPDLCMLLPRDLLESTLVSLRKIAMLSRVAVTIDEEQSIIGFYHPDTLAPSLSGYELHTLSEGFSIAIVKNKDKSTILKPYQDKQQLRGSLAWHALLLARKHVEIYPQTAGKFLPHHLDLHKNGYIHFDKGCYKGQEIIARMHYKATLKQGLGIFEKKVSMQDLQDLIDNGATQPWGELVDFSPVGNGLCLVAAIVPI